MQARVTRVLPEFAMAFLLSANRSGSAPERTQDVEQGGSCDFEALVFASCLHIHSSKALSGCLQRKYNALLPLSKTKSKASVLILAPLYFPRRITRPVSYYAFFKGWLLLSQPPGCLRPQDERWRRA